MKTGNPRCGIFRIDEYGYPRFAYSEFLPRSEARELRDSEYPGCVVMTYGEFKARQDPDDMSERELRVRLGLPPQSENQRCVVITGTFPDMTRHDAKRHAEARGYKVVSKVSRNVSHIWAGEKPGGTKIAAAQSLNIPIVAMI